MRSRPRWIVLALGLLVPLLPAAAAGSGADFYPGDRLFGEAPGAIRLALQLIADGLPEAARAPLETYRSAAPVTERPRVDLLLGQVLLRLGEPGRAAEVLAEGGGAGLASGLAGWHAALLGEALFQAGDRLAAEAELARAVSALGPGPARRQAVLRRADCFLALGTPARAARLLGRSGVDAPPGFALLADGLAALQRGDRAAAARALRSAAVRAAGTALDEPIRVHLTALAAAGEARAVLTRNERLERIRRLLKAREGEAAEREIAALPAAARETHEVRFLAARARFVRKEHRAAAAAFAALARRAAGQPEREAVALRQQAKALAYAGELAAALDLNQEVVRRFPKTPVAGEALYYSGYLSMALHRWPAAIRIFSGYLKRRPRGAGLANARWYQAWSLVRGGDRTAALAALERVQKHGDYLERIGARYWRARLLSAGGSATAAARIDRAVAADPPWLYYGVLARERLREGGAAAPELLPLPVAATTPAPPATLPRAVQGAVDRAVLLARHGLLAAAVQALVPLSDRLAPDPGAALALGDLFTRLGSPRRAYLLALRAGRAARQAAPTPATLALWRASYPRPFQAEVRAAAARHDLDEALLFAVVRQESAFDPGAVSWAGARGLLQLMPETGASIAAARGLAGYAPDWLFEPATNVDLAAWYLAALLRKYRGNLALTAAAYNGGVPHLTRWLARYGGGPLDVFVEEIPFDETRGYTRKVLSSYVVYRRLYDADPAPLTELPLTVEAEYPGVVEF